MTDFVALSNEEMMNVDGGLIEITLAKVAIGTGILAAEVTTGLAVGTILKKLFS